MLSGEFEIDMNSIQNINLEGDELQPILVNHLKSDDFFFTDRFPRASFQFEKATPAAEAFTSFPNYDIEGILDLCGVKADLRFPATLNETAEEKLVAEAHFDFDRTRWGIIYGSSRFFEHLGMHLVFDLVSIQIRIVSQ
jgi:polyisoprenoid-binding protein YceI